VSPPCAGAGGDRVLYASAVPFTYRGSESCGRPQEFSLGSPCSCRRLRVRRRGSSSSKSSERNADSDGRPPSAVAHLHDAERILGRRRWSKPVPLPGVMGQWPTGSWGSGSGKIPRPSTPEYMVPVHGPHRFHPSSRLPASVITADNPELAPFAGASRKAGRAVRCRVGGIGTAVWLVGDLVFTIGVGIRDPPPTSDCALLLLDRQTDSPCSSATATSRCTATALTRFRRGTRRTLERFGSLSGDCHRIAASGVFGHVPSRAPSRNGPFQLPWRARCSALLCRLLPRCRPDTSRGGLVDRARKWIHGTRRTVFEPGGGTREGFFGGCSGSGPVRAEAVYSEVGE